MAEELTSTVAPTSAEPQTIDPTAPEVPKQKDPNEKRWAHMARKEKELRAREMKFKSEMAAFESERMAAKQASEWKTRLSQKDFDVLKETGITQEDLTNYLVGQPNPQDPIVKELRAEIAALRGGQDAIKKDMEDKVSREYKQAIQNLSSEAQSAAKSDPERFELVNANMEDAVGAATNLIEEIWKKTGRVITVEEALNDVEEYYLETLYNSFANSKKLKSKWQPVEPTAPVKLPSAPGKPSFTTAVRESIEKAPVKTLTHQQIPMPIDKPLSQKDRRERAIAAFMKKS